MAHVPQIEEEIELETLLKIRREALAHAVATIGCWHNPDTVKEAATLYETHMLRARNV